MSVHPDPKTGRHSLERLARFYFGLRCQDGLAPSSLEKLETDLRLGIFGIVVPRAPWAEDVTPRVAQDSLDECQASRGPTAAVSLRDVGGCMWRRLQREGVYTLANPWPLTKRPKEQSRCFPISAEDAKAIDAICRAVTLGESDVVSVPLAYWVRVTLRIGCRAMESLSLAWDEIDFRAQTATKTEHKTKRSHGAKDIDVSAALPILVELYGRGLDTKWCFPGRGGHLKHVHRQWKKLVTLIGRPEYRIHDMRHGFAVQMLEAGASIRDVAKALGHRDIKSTAIYDRIRTSQRARSLANEAMKGVFGE